MSFKKPLKLFIAYAHEDESFKDQLTKRLEILKQENEIEVWHDGELIPGDRWRKVRDNYLHNADVMLYLVSADSLASVECNKEIADALDNQKRFVPIILHECDWKRHEVGGSSIAEFHALPKDGKPIDSWEKKDEAWRNVIDGFRKILDTVKEQEDASQSTPFELGNAKYMLGALDEARMAYTKAIALEPDLARAHYNRGLLFGDIKQYDKALADYTKAIELKPDFTEAYYNRGLLFSNIKQYDKALADYTKAIDINPNHAIIYNNRGNLFSDFKQYNKAAADFDKAIELKPNDAEAYNNRGTLFGQLEQYDKAEMDFTKAIELKPGLAEAYCNRGFLFSNIEQYDKALADYTKAIELKPNFAGAYYNRGGLLHKLGQYDKAKADSDKAIYLDPNFAEAYYNRGLLFSNIKQYDKALADYTKAIELKPNFAGAYYNRGGLFSDLKQYDKAEEDLNKAIELKSDFTEAYYNRGLLFSNIKQYDKALADYTKAIDINPNHAIIYNNRGNLFNNLKQYDKALADYTKAIDINPNHAIIYNNRGTLFGQLGQYDKAEMDFTKAIELQPGLAESYYNRGNLLNELKQYNEAVADVKKAKVLSQKEGNQGGVAVCELWLNKNKPSSDSPIKFSKSKGNLLTGRNKSKKERILEVMYDLNHSLKGCETQLSANSERIDELQRLSGVLARTCSIFLRKMVIGDRGNKKTRLLNDEILQSLELKFSKIIKIPEKRRTLNALNMSSSGSSMNFKKINETTGLPESNHNIPISPMECTISIDWPLPGVANWTGNPTEENMWCIQEKELFDTKNNDVFDCDEWLGQQLVIFDDKGITLKEVIKTIANYEGAHASNVFRLSQPENDDRNYGPAIRPELDILNSIKFFEVKYNHIVVIESALYLYEKLIKSDLCKSMRGHSYKAPLCFASPSPENTFLEYSKWLRYDGLPIPTFGNEKMIISHRIRAVG